MVAARGPVPKRSEDRARRNKVDTTGITKGTMRPVAVPEPGEHWHPIAARLYNSLGSSGQADFYQNSDWAFAWSLCDDLSDYKMEEDRRKAMAALADHWWTLTPDERKEQGLGTSAPGVPKGGSAMKLTAIYGALDRLMVTEADRRRLRIELQEPVDEGPDADVLVMDRYRKGLALGE